MSTKTITAETIAWLPSYQNIAAFSQELKEGKTNDAVDRLSFYAVEMGTGVDPWTRIGKATLKIEVLDEEDIVVNAIRSMRSEQQATRANAELKVQELERKIQTLLAISHDAQVSE